MGRVKFDDIRGAVCENYGKEAGSVIAGASLISELESMMQKAGFRNIRIMPKYDSRDFIKDWALGSRIEDHVVSAMIEAVRPEA